MMLDRAHVLLKEERKDLRIKEDEHLSWRIKYKQRDGRARIRNISATGMQVETNVPFDPKEDCILSFDSTLGEKNYIPRLGRLVWSRKKRFSPGNYLCGIKFLEADEKVLTRMRNRVERGVKRYLSHRRITTTIGFMLCIAAIVMIEYITYSSTMIYRKVTAANSMMAGVAAHQTSLTRNTSRRLQMAEANLTNQSEKLQIARQIIAEDKLALSLFAKDLDATQALLGSTEEMLTESKVENAQLSEQNTQLSTEIAALQAEVQAQLAKQASAAAVANVEMSMAEYRLKLQSIKDKMRQLKDKDRAARFAAVARMDAQKSKIGNNGYFVKKGRTVNVNEDQYNRLDVASFTTPATQNVNRDVEINVTFFDNP